MTTTTWLTRGLVSVAAVAAAVTVLVPDLLSGTAVMNGSARGTAWVVLLVAVPLLGLSLPGVTRGSRRALALATGAVAYLTYNAVMFAFATPFNPAFLLYVAMLSLSVWSLLGLVAHVRGLDVDATQVAPRWTGVYVLVVVALNTAAWLGVVVPATYADEPTAFLDGTGLTTNPVFVQDLAVWLPAMAWLGLALVRLRPDVVVLAAAGLTFWVVEAIGVAVDQWAGHLADPSSTVVSQAAVPGFAALAVVGTVPLLVVLRRVPAGLAPSGGARR
ncbi:hypothetical protein [Nocardioides euryhalodurans]|uniref:Uncharacterized protein n=1 Tax=Nocardioides euryhalodurans TaxID=2518370 RepID=A0A4P7GLL1_9ACTN|nr:hypothetical protein [Nocardioides euryhalodurans]QBR92853.1 hypothetical protein EXE57_11625 [Nocardioides euryhalodurans]